MSPKLLQKNSNRFLQLSPPENLIPNKRLGKREKNRSRRPIMEHSRVEGELCRQWVFSWNTLKKRMQEEKRKFLQTSSGSIKLPASLTSTKFAVFSREQGRHVISPALHMLKERINHAIGGNITDHLNEYVRNVQSTKNPCASALQESSTLTGRQGQSSDQVKEWYLFPEDQEKGCSAADFLAQQIESSFFHMIYSLQEKGKWGARREKINDDYRNQLAECRKIAFLYGDLRKKTLVRTMRRAKRLAGDVDCNFFSLLERRLDVALKRAFFFSTLKQARQWIQRGKILVNNQPISVSSYLLQPADFITIIPRARIKWRKQSLARALLAISTQPRDNIFTCSTLASQDLFNLLKKERRFPFSPALMRKWKEWSQLWSNWQYPNSTGHKWGTMKRPSPVVTNFVDSLKMRLEFSSSSAFGTYFSGIKNANAHMQRLVAGERKVAFLKKKTPLLRRESAISNWLHGDRMTANQRKNASGHLDYTKEAKGNFLEKKVAASQFFTNAFPEKYTCCQWLHQQKSYVLDGLYALRWNKVFATRKSFLEKKKRWRWSCIKPIHLECSYRHCTMIFLYSPQKLAWPSSINVSLLRKALGG